MVVRHAKAEQFAPSDVERALSPRGRADGRALGEWLARQGIVAEAAYVSHAARTRETWQVLAGGAGWDVEAQVDGMLYGTDELGVLELVHATPDTVGTVVVVGHNPTMAMLAQQLDDGMGAATGSVELGTFPTSTAAAFEVIGQWSDMAPMRARLEAFHVGRASDG